MSLKFGRHAPHVYWLSLSGQSNYARHSCICHLLICLMENSQLLPQHLTQSSHQSTHVPDLKITNCWNLPAPATMMTRFFPVYSRKISKSTALPNKTPYHKNKIFISRRIIFFLQAVDRLWKQLNSLAKLASGTKLWLTEDQVAIKHF